MIKIESSTDETTKKTRAQRIVEERADEEARVNLRLVATPQALAAERIKNDKNGAELARLARIMATAPDPRVRLVAADERAGLVQGMAAKRIDAARDALAATTDDRERARLMSEYSDARCEYEIAELRVHEAFEELGREDKRLESKECEAAALPFAMLRKATLPACVAGHTQEARKSVVDAARVFVDAVTALNAVYAVCNDRIDKLRTARDVLGRTDALPPYELQRDPLDLLAAVIGSNETKEVK